MLGTVDGHLHHFPFGAETSNTVMNITAHALCWARAQISVGSFPGEGIAQLYGVSSVIEPPHKLLKQSLRFSFLLAAYKSSSF